MKVSIWKTAFFAGNYTPKGWLLGDGSKIPQDDYLITAAGMLRLNLQMDSLTMTLPKLAPIGSINQYICKEGAFPPDFEEMDLVGFITSLEDEGINKVPNNWLLCDGKELELNISPNQYLDLYGIIGGTYGKRTAPGKTFYCLPNLNKPGSKRYIICFSGFFLQSF
jgi:Phage Tail Collar Domain